jgi:Uma2 family endonuclease
MATNPTIDVVPDPYDVDPAWDLDRSWSEVEYLKLDTNRLVEFVDGMIEVLPMPTLLHQLIVKYLLFQLDAYVSAPGLGTVLAAPFPVFTRETRYREPDVLFLSKKTASEIRLEDASCDHADLVMEVVSDDDRRRDLHTKRREYAQARIPEYWIVDPRDETITVLTLGARKKAYTVHGVFRAGDRATSLLLPGFDVDVTEVFARKV